MKNYEEMIIDLALQTNSATDYLEKKKVRNHNKAMTKLYEIANELKKNTDCASLVYSKLLHHPDEKVKFIAAAHLFQLRICENEARKIMYEISVYSNDPFIKSQASMFLER